MDGSAAVNTSPEMTEEGKKSKHFFFSKEKWPDVVTPFARRVIPLQTHKCNSGILGGVIQMANSTW